MVHDWASGDLPSHPSQVCSIVWPVPIPSFYGVGEYFVKTTIAKTVANALLPSVALYNVVVCVINILTSPVFPLANEGYRGAPPNRATSQWLPPIYKCHGRKRHISTKWTLVYKKLSWENFDKPRYYLVGLQINFDVANISQYIFLLISISTLGNSTEVAKWWIMHAMRLLSNMVEHTFMCLFAPSNLRIGFGELENTHV